MLYLCRASNVSSSKMLDADFTAEEMFERAPNAKTFPQIFIDGEAIGGFTELEKLHG